MTNTHGEIITFGKHRGTLVTRAPVSYLRWMVNNNTKQCELARAELERRGSTLPLVEISGHAVDRASLRVVSIWKKTRNPDEGLYSWLERMTLEALKVAKHRGEQYKYRGMKLVITQGEEYPALKSVMKIGAND